MEFHSIQGSYVAIVELFAWACDGASVVAVGYILTMGFVEWPIQFLGWFAATIFLILYVMPLEDGDITFCHNVM